MAYPRGANRGRGFGAPGQIEEWRPSAEVLDGAGRSQPDSPGWARVPLSSFFPQISINFSSNFSYFLPHFGPPGGQVAHPGRPWLRHWMGEGGSMLEVIISFSDNFIGIRLLKIALTLN